MVKFAEDDSTYANIVSHLDNISEILTGEPTGYARHSEIHNLDEESTAQPPIQHVDQAHDVALSDEINMISMLSKDGVLDLRNGLTEIMGTAAEDLVYENLDVIVTEEPFEEEEINHADTSAWFRIQDQTQQDIKDSVNERLELDHRRDSYPGAGILARDVVDSVQLSFSWAPGCPVCGAS